MTYALTILFALLQVGDWFTTRRVLAHGGRESNPVMRQLVAQLGLNGAFALKGIAMAVLGYFLARYFWPFAVVGCAVYVWVCCHNWRQVR